MRAVDIFIAYAHNDLAHKNELKKFLRPLINTGQAQLWDDYEIEGGQNWEAEIKKRLYGSDVILLLVSPDSLASEYFYGQEVKVSLERHDKGEAAVVPVILRPCTWKLTPLKQLEAIPEKGRPVTSWTSQDEAYTDIAHSIGSIVETRQAAIAAATMEEEKQREFSAVVETAEHLFHKKQWTEAQKAFVAALALHQPGYLPDYNALESRYDTCVSEQQQEKDQAAREHKKAQYADLLKAAENEENSQRKIALLKECIALYRPGFPGNPEALREQVQQLRALAHEPTVDSQTTGASTPRNAKVWIWAGVGLLMMVVVTILIRNIPRNDKPERQNVKPVTEQPAPNWKNAATIPALQKWLQENPGSPAQDRADANKQLEAWRQERKRDLEDARRALEYKEYVDAKKYIQNILRLNPDDAEALSLKKKLKQ